MASTSTTAQREAARAARNDRVAEVVLLLSALTKDAATTWPAHLAPVDNAGASSTMNYVVCIHRDDRKLAWRISDFEAFEYFGHLKRNDCGGRGLPRADKMAHLAAMASKGWTA